MLRTAWHHPRRDLPAPEEARLPAATRDHAAQPTRRQDDGAGDREAYYAYHLGRAVQHYHQRLFATPQWECARQERLGCEQWGNDGGHSTGVRQLSPASPCSPALGTSYNAPDARAGRAEEARP